jgi:hypothetical protein
MGNREVIELRVHGVSGTPPEQLLDCPLVIQEAGDAKAGFYIPRLPEEQRDPRLTPSGAVNTSGPKLEGYAWGGLTSGAATRALWLLLLPFTFINVCPRMRPAGKTTDDLIVKVMWFVSRLLALSMTALLVVGMAGVGVDLFGWQCNTEAAGDPSPDCSKASPGWILKPILGVSLEHRLLIGAAFPLLVLIFLWKVSDRTINNYESVPTIFTADDGKANATEPDLHSRWMWRNEYQVRRLRHLHLQAGYVAICWIVTAAFDNELVKWLRVIIGIGILLYILWRLLDSSYTGRLQRDDFKLQNQIVWGVLIAAGVVVIVLLAGFHPLRDRKPNAGLPDYAGTAELVFLAQLLLYFAFAICILVMMVSAKGTHEDVPARRTDPRSLGGGSAILFATLGVFLGAVFASGIYIFAAGWLTTGSLKPGFDDVSKAAITFDVPDVVRDASRAYAVSIAAAAVFLVGVGLLFAANRVVRWIKPQRWPSAQYTDMLVADYENETKAPMDDAHKSRAKTIAQVFWFARLVDVAHRYLAALVATGFVITAAFVWMLMHHAGVVHQHPWLPSAVERWHDHVSCQTKGCDEGIFFSGYLSAGKLQGTGAYLAVLTLLLLVTVGAAAFRAQKTRKTVGILWDLASFWPRAAHPFAAPCYAERAVPDLTTRISYHLDQQRSVVLAAHSQGTVLSAATLFQLARYDLELSKDEWYVQLSDDKKVEVRMMPHLAFLTFGCVLRRLYSRYFPAYFEGAELATLQADLAGQGVIRWRNLWRHSDYLGGQVTAGPPQVVLPNSDPTVAQPNPAIEAKLVDPPWDRKKGDTQFTVAARHSDYWRAEEFSQEVAKLAALLA